MNDSLNSLGSFVFWVFAIFIVILAGVVWYAFEYWYLVFGIPIVIFIVFFVTNFKELRRSYKIEMDKIARKEEGKQ
ncbi:hypothetical protein [Capnocytophaga canimorsus]|uniref:hypothetical protein n=1 Tax=Capnocytophaga canimorsus TaxID=28188 RepID=UPI000F50EE1A|nr:hypothetical protein [Capnocytophaga canimorsus]AYW37888.1 hypothetical protein D8L92_11745 [Capnocytophaga canimorsus]